MIDIGVSSYELPKVFISYSSNDEEFAERLAKDLQHSGIEIWFDKWEIKVGESIASKINKGLKSNDFLAVVLSPNSVKSQWVEKELNIGLMKELGKKSVTVLPVLFKDCEMPPIISDKKYADFRQHYNIGLGELLEAILLDREAKVSILRKEHLELEIYDVFQGYSAVVERRELNIVSSIENTDKIIQGEGTELIEIILKSPDISYIDHSELYESYYEHYNMKALKIDKRISVMETTGLDIAKWKVSIDIHGLNQKDVEDYINRIIDIHNELIKICKLKITSTLNEPFKIDKIDEKKFLKTLLNSPLSTIRKKKEIEEITRKFTSYFNIIAEKEIEINKSDFLGLIYTIITECFLEFEADVSEKDLNIDNLNEKQREKYAIYEMSIIDSFDWLRELWAEVVIRNMPPEKIQKAKKGFEKYRLGGLVEALDGDIIKGFRKAGISYIEILNVIETLGDEIED